MGLLDTLSFNEDKYRRKTSSEDSYVLRKKHHAKVRTEALHIVGVGASLTMAAATAGTSLLGTAYSARQISVVRQQREIIEEELSYARDMEIPRYRVRDVVAGVGLGAASALIAAGLPVIMDDAVGTGADAVVDYSTGMVYAPGYYGSYVPAGYYGSYVPPPV